LLLRAAALDINYKNPILPIHPAQSPINVSNKYDKKTIKQELIDVVEKELDYDSIVSYLHLFDNQDYIQIKNGDTSDTIYDNLDNKIETTIRNNEEDEKSYYESNSNELNGNINKEYPILVDTTQNQTVYEDMKNMKWGFTKLNKKELEVRNKKGDLSKNKGDIAETQVIKILVKNNKNRTFIKCFQPLIQTNKCDEIRVLNPKAGDDNEYIKSMNSPHLGKAGSNLKADIGIEFYTKGTKIEFIMNGTKVTKVWLSIKSTNGSQQPC
jgi:hypothetical protein